MAEHIVAVYETEKAADAAEGSLRSAGIPESSIRRYAGNTSVRYEAPNSTSHTSGGGFWSWLLGEEPVSETTRSAYPHDAYDRKVGAGNVVLAVTVDDSRIHDVVATLEAHSPVDIDERADETDEETVATGASSLTAPSTAGRDFASAGVAEAGAAGARLASGGLRGGAVNSGATATTGASPAMADASVGRSQIEPSGAEKREEVVPLAEEQIEIGKRTVDRGTTRIRRYVVEKPVEENVTLRGERVTVERRQPRQGAAAPNAGAFEERVVEVRETTEEPVVAKTAHVIEEVVVGREATERTETVKDTVRREQAEISKDSDLTR